MTRLAVFRCDASPKIGGGHVTRCLALAETLEAAGWKIVFAVRPQTIATVPSLAAYRIIDLQGGAATEAAEIEAALAQRVDWLIVDHNGRGIEFESSCRTWAKRIFAISDFANRKHDCDLLLDQTIGRDQPADRGLHDPLVPAHCQLILGADYALVRSQFTNLRDKAEKKRSHPERAHRLLMSFGATDPWGLTETMLKAVLKENHSLAVDVVAGTSPSPELAMLAKSDGRVTLHHAVKDMASLMLAADLSSGLAGTSAYERCTVGLPSMLFVPSNHYREISARLEAAGVVELADEENFDAGEAARRLLALAANPEHLSSMSNAAFAFCDGNGAGRIAAILQS